MENPLEILGISKQTTDEDMVTDIERTIKEISRYLEGTRKAFAENAQVGLRFAGKSDDFFGDDVIRDLSEKFACDFDCKNRFFSYYEFRNLRIKQEIESRKSLEAGETKKSQNAVFYSNVLMSQIMKLQRYKENYQNVVNRYNEEGRKGKAREALKDLYVKIKFEDEVIALSESISKKTPKTFSADENKRAFEESLRSDERYKRLRRSYEKVATESDRADLIPELFVKSRLGNPDLLETASTEWKKYIIRRENQYKMAHLSEIADDISGKRRVPKLAENPDHDYSWGIVVDNPKYVMKNVPVDNANFQGRISVKHLGYFSAETLFSKRKLLRERHQNIEIVDTPITVVKDNKRFRLKQKNGKDATIRMKIHTPNPAIPEHMRDYYYRHEATVQLFNNIYLVQKADSQGVKTEDLVFSPIEKEDFSKPELRKFLSEVYFSNYALNIARKNGGFAGTVVKTPRGPAISTIDNETEIASSVLYQNDSEGRLIDRSDTGDGKWRDLKGSEANFILRNKGKVRERSKDE